MDIGAVLGDDESFLLYFISKRSGLFGKNKKSTNQYRDDLKHNITSELRIALNVALVVDMA